MNDSLTWAWYLAAQLLSLDVIKDLFDVLGVSVNKPDELRQASREWLTGKPVRSDALQGQPGKVTLVTYESLDVSAFSGNLEALLGRLDADRVRFWVQYIHCKDLSLNPWVALKEYFSWWVNMLGFAGQDRIGLQSVDPRKIEEDYRQCVWHRDPEPKFVLPEWTSMSGWDQFLFERHGFLSIPPHSDYVPFQDDVELTARMHRFQVFFWRSSRSSQPA